MVVTIEERGWVFVNGDFAVTVDLSNGGCMMVM